MKPGNNLGSIQFIMRSGIKTDLVIDCTRAWQSTYDIDKWGWEGGETIIVWHENQNAVTGLACHLRRQIIVQIKWIHPVYRDISVMYWSRNRLDGAYHTPIRANELVYVWWSLVTSQDQLLSYVKWNQFQNDLKTYWITICRNILMIPYTAEVPYTLYMADSMTDDELNN